MSQLLQAFSQTFFILKTSSVFKVKKSIIQTIFNILKFECITIFSVYHTCTYYVMCMYVCSNFYKFENKHYLFFVTGNCNSKEVKTQFSFGSRWQELNPGLPHYRQDILPAEPQGKPRNTGVGSLSLLQRICLT